MRKDHDRLGHILERFSEFIKILCKNIVVCIQGQNFAGFAHGNAKSVLFNIYHFAFSSGKNKRAHSVRLLGRNEGTKKISVIECFRMVRDHAEVQKIFLFDLGKIVLGKIHGALGE